MKNQVVTTTLGKKATLLQFSTTYCGQCPGVRRQLAQLEYRLGGLSHLEVDITERLDVAAHFSINQTPTVFLLNSHGELVYRVGGIPNMTKLNQELEKLGVK
jgi:thiol-disulfide isomerase/thioredoxin